VAANQSAFIKGRYILESVVVAHEIVHSIHSSHIPGVVLKLDYEKAYDRVSWDFLFEVFKTRNFSPVWTNWMELLVKGGSVGVNMNGEESSFFSPGKELRQGDPISPFLFNLVVVALNRMLEKAARGGLIKGLLTDFTPNGIISLQYADDTIIFYDCEESHLRNLKSCLCLFEQISGMRINFHKTEVIPMNLDQTQIHEISHIFGCPVGSFPMKYLGVALHFDKLKREEVQPLIDKVLKKIGSWRGRLLSSAARVVLIKTCLASIPVYLLSSIKFPKWALQLINTHMTNYLWGDEDDKHKFHLVNWETVSMCKDFGGLGIPNLRDLNLCLLGSWLRRYQVSGEKLWRQLLDFKYNTSDPNIFHTSSWGLLILPKVSCGLQVQLKWGSCGRLAMAKK